MLGVEYHIILNMPESCADGVASTIDDCVVVKVVDEGAGPYLVVKGRNIDFDEAFMDEHSIVICDERDVDNLAHALKRILREHASATFDQGVKK